MSSGYIPTTANIFGAPPGLNLASQPSVNLPFGINPYLSYGQFPGAQRIKLKRTRQRVDAGEPRNTYSSIPNFTGGGGGGSGTPGGTGVGVGGGSRGSLVSSPRFGSPTSMYPGISTPVEQMNRMMPFDPNNLLPHMQTAWYRSLQQQAASMNSSTEEVKEEEEEEVKQEEVFEGGDGGAGEGSGEGRRGAADEDAEGKTTNGNKDERGGEGGSPCKVCDEKGVMNEGTEENGTNSPETNDPSTLMPDESKKARVENIINSIQSVPSSPTPSHNEEKNSDSNSKDSSPRSKRKQYQPQQVDGATEDDDLPNTAAPEDKEDSLDEDMDEDEDKSVTAGDDTKVNKVQELFAMQQQLYMEWLGQQQRNMMGQHKPQTHTLLDTNGETEERPPPPKTSKVEVEDNSKDLKTMAQTLKTELMSALNHTVDKIVNDYLQAEAAARAAQQQRIKASFNAEQATLQRPQSTNRPPFYMNPFYHYPYGGAASSFSMGGPTPSTMAGASTASIFPGFPGAPMYMGAGGMGGGVMSRKEDAFSLVLPRKRRSKVTDTRLAKMPLRGDESRNSPGGYFPPTMVGHPLYGATFAGLDEREAESPTNSDDASELGGVYDHTSQTLSPMHLRKAKLMFFYTRYPSSQLLKSYFPDIHFKKETTAQLVKWFSNFREFYYIQMEKYAKQALAEGVRRPEDIHVTLDSELYKILNQHYNRNNHIPVPPKFREVVEATLREFFLSIQAGKDAEASWKKQIYKVIARLDDTIPEYFKQPNFLEQLE